jgi:hypothetical protein
MLTAQVQRFPAGHQKLQVRTALKQFPHHWGRRSDLLKVIKAQEHRLASEPLLECIEQRPVTYFPYADRSGNRSGYGRRLADGGQVDKINPICEVTGRF